MAYPGRILSPDSASLTKGKTWLWKDSVLNRHRRNVEEAKQLPSRGMIQMESLSTTALPSTDISNVSGASKYSQIGQDAAYKLLKAATASWLVGHSVGSMCSQDTLA